MNRFSWIFILQSKGLWDDVKYRFFIKYLNDFSKEAGTYFVKRINQELPYTGDRHYFAIADSLKALKKLTRKKQMQLLNK